ncbi:MAG: DUF488 family protein [bacterium]|nr:DUF488 family protein [bacterium]
MYYRRKILLALLQHFGGTLRSIDFQKYLFLLNEMSDKKYYHFVPYKYGCFSFQSYADKRTLTKYNILVNNDSWVINDSVDYFSQLTGKDQQSLYRLREKFGSMKGSTLIEYIYTKYPYYAINSELAYKYLTEDDLQQVRCDHSSPGLFTLGYESRSIDEYVNCLVANNINLLCDVRKNARSMKYGFSKNQLKSVIEKLGIEYLHVPQLGIESDKRKPINGILDYEKLFAEYYTEIYNKKISHVESLNEVVQTKKRVALTCFEFDYNKCHRYVLAKILSERKNMNYKIINL